MSTGAGPRPGGTDAGWADAGWPDTLLIVGCGNMGGAMLARWLARGLDPARVTIVDPRLAEAPAGIMLRREVAALAGGRFDAVLLAFKPQQLAALASELAPLADAGTRVFSILAGADLARLGALFPRARAIVRVLPNLAAAIGKAPIGLAATGLDASAQDAVSRFMIPFGTPEWFADDRLFDALTALAGSGPAFVYRFIDALAAAGAGLGLEAAQAGRLALAMVEGAALLAAGSSDPPAELARKVASPGGTTEAGLAVLDEHDALLRLVSATLGAATVRAAALAG